MVNTISNESVCKERYIKPEHYFGVFFCVCVRMVNCYCGCIIFWFCYWKSWVMLMKFSTSYSLPSSFLWSSTLVSVSISISSFGQRFEIFHKKTERRWSKRNTCSLLGQLSFKSTCKTRKLSGDKHMNIRTHSCLNIEENHKFYGIYLASNWWTLISLLRYADYNY